MTLDISVLIPHNSAVLATAATGGTERNWGKRSRPLVAISQHTNLRENASCCGLMANTALGLCSPTWQLSRAFPEAKNTASSITRSSRRVCTCPPLSSNGGKTSQIVRNLYDCPQVPVGPEEMLCRVVVATHPAGKKKSPVGVTRAGGVYELFFTTLPQQACTACDVVELYLLSFAFEPTLADEDQELDPDRWCSHAASLQECWQVVAQWGCFLRAVPGPSPSARTFAHDRVCPCSFTSAVTHGSVLRVYPSRGRLRMESWSLLRPRFHAPTRRNPPLSSKPGASCP
jgi:hypothetical protein